MSTDPGIVERQYTTENGRCSVWNTSKSYGKCQKKNEHSTAEFALKVTVYAILFLKSNQNKLTKNHSKVIICVFCFIKMITENHPEGLNGSPCVYCRVCFIRRRRTILFKQLVLFRLLISGHNV